MGGHWLFGGGLSGDGWGGRGHGCERGSGDGGWVMGGLGGLYLGMDRGRESGLL